MGVSNNESESRRLIETWIHRIFLIVVALIGFFLQDTLGQVRETMKHNSNKIELLENILIEVRVSSRKDSERYKEIREALQRLDDKYEKQRD